MKTVQIQAYSFDELSDRAKDRARKLIGYDYHWGDESIGSIQAFCDHFGVKIKDYSIGAYSPSWLTTNADNEHFRGFTLKNAKALPESPTGYCMDYTMREVFIKEFERTGNAKQAFEDAIDAAVSEWVADMEFQSSDEAISETCEINGLLFTESGHLAA